MFLDLLFGNEALTVVSLYGTVSTLNAASSTFAQQQQHLVETKTRKLRSCGHMINRTGLVAANSIAFLLSLLTAQTIADQAVRWNAITCELFESGNVDDREQEDFIIFYGWWTNEIKFKREKSQSYAQDSAGSF